MGATNNSFTRRRARIATQVRPSGSTSSSETRGNAHHSLPLLTQELDRKIQVGAWRSDPTQKRTAKKLERLQKVLDGYSNEVVIEYLTELESMAERKEKEEETVPETDPKEMETSAGELPVEPNKPIPEPPMIPRGFYLHGSVGSGKSMLMDFFLEHLRVAKKRRFHFHEFMAMVHRRVHNLKQEQLLTLGRSFSIDVSLRNNPIRNVAIQLARETSVLCLDEFQVTDVADAMILKQLFSTLWAMGTVVVTTSNRLPSELYEEGLNRSYFLPFIEQLENHCIVHTMNSDVDYRVVLATEDSTVDRFFFNQSDSMQERKFRDIVEQLRNGRVESPVTVEIGFNRQLFVERGDSEGRLAQFQFEELCDVELGASDYRAIAKHFDIVSIHNIPTMTLEDPNRARRFVTLVDELYEDKSTALICLADHHDDPFKLFRGRRHPVDGGPVSYDQLDPDAVNLGIDQAKKNDQPVGALASVHELSFAFQRAGSRIVEMTSRRWWESIVGILS